MYFLWRTTRFALIAWALCLAIALASLSLHVDASHGESDSESGAPVCALCIARNAASDAVIVAPPVVVFSTWCRLAQPWRPRAEIVSFAALKRADNSRAPPAKCFSSPQLI